MGMSNGSQETWRISVNPAHRSSVWWDYARARYDAPESLAPLLEFFGAQAICVDAADAAAIRVWATQVPEWDDEEPPILIGIYES